MRMASTNPERVEQTNPGHVFVLNAGRSTPSGVVVRDHPFASGLHPELLLLNPCSGFDFEYHSAILDLNPKEWLWKIKPLLHYYNNQQ